MSDRRPRAARYRYEQAVDRAIHAIAAQRLAETTTIRRYVEYLAEPVGDFADAGPGYYLLEDRETPTGTEYGVIVAGPVPDPVYEQAEQAARAWFRAASRSPSALFFLYYLPHGLRLAVGTDAPGEGWELADRWRIPPTLTEAQAREWIYTTARRLPLYPVEEQAR